MEGACADGVCIKATVKEEAEKVNVLLIVLIAAFVCAILCVVVVCLRRKKNSAESAFTSNVNPVVAAD